MGMKIKIKSNLLYTIIPLFILLSFYIYGNDFVNKESIILNIDSHKIQIDITDYRIIYKDEIGHISTISTPKGERILDFIVASRGIGNDESLIVIIGKNHEAYGNRIEIYDVSDSGEIIKTLERSMEKMNPWELKIADVNGDGINEIGITMYKKTRFHPVLANRPYIYSWKEDEIIPYWRGSRLSRPFSQYGYKDVNNDGRDELVAVEYLENEKEVIDVYGWKGFGFESIGQSEVFDEIGMIILNNKDPIRALIDKQWIDFRYNVENAKIENVLGGNYE